MKLSQLNEARYAGHTNTYIVFWPVEDWSAGDTGPATHYAYGETSATQGVYTSEDGIIVVADDQRKAMKFARLSSLDFEQQEYGASMEWAERPIPSEFKNPTYHLSSRGTDVHTATGWWDFEGPLGTKIGYGGAFR